MCVLGSLRISVTSMSTTLTYAGPKNNYELTELCTNLFHIESDAFVRYISGQPEIIDTFTTNAKLYISEDGKNKDFSSIQFLTYRG